MQMTIFVTMMLGFDVGFDYDDFEDIFDDTHDDCDENDDWKVWLLRVWSVSHHPPSNMQLGISTIIIKDNYDKDYYANCHCDKYNLKL